MLTTFLCLETSALKLHVTRKGQHFSAFSQPSKLTCNTSRLNSLVPSHQKPTSIFRADLFDVSNLSVFMVTHSPKGCLHRVVLFGQQYKPHKSLTIHYNYQECWRCSANAETFAVLTKQISDFSSNVFHKCRNTKSISEKHQVFKYTSTNNSCNS